MTGDLETAVATARDNPALLGQEAAEAAFLSAWRSGRVPHAWLLTGPRGIGKATLAFRVARYVLAGGEGETLAVDAANPTFRRVAAGSHGDLFVLEPGAINPETNKPSREIVIGQVRQLTGFLARTSAEGGWRVAIIDTAEAMNRNAANALLKVLEEPPARCLIILTSNAPGRLLATIRSRCRRLPMTALDDATVARLLVRYRGLGAGEAADIARLAGGSIGRAVELADAGGLALQEDIFSLLSRLPALPIPDIHGFADRIARPAKEASDAFPLALELLADWAAERGRKAGSGDVESWLSLWDKIVRLQTRTDAINLDRKLVLLEVFLAIAETARGSQPSQRR